MRSVCCPPFASSSSRRPPNARREADPTLLSFSRRAMSSSSQPSASSQKAELTPAQLKRRLAVQAAMAKFAAGVDGGTTGATGTGRETAAAATITAPAAPAPPVPPTPEEAVKSAEQQAIDDKLAKLSPSQRSLYKAGLYLLPAEKKGKAQEAPPSTSDVKPVVPDVPKITPVGRSQSWLTGGDNEGDAIELDSTDDDEPATPVAAPQSSVDVDTTGSISAEAAAREEKSILDSRQEKLIANRRRASAKRARGGFDTDSSEEEKDADVKPSRCVRRSQTIFVTEGVADSQAVACFLREVKARTQRALSSRETKATGSRIWLAIPEPKESKPKPAVPEGPAIVLSGEQELVRDLIVHDGVSLFFTGSAGASRRCPRRRSFCARLL